MNKRRKENNNTPEIGKLILTLVIVLCASIIFTNECFQVKDFFDTTVAIPATVEQIEEAQDGYFIKMTYEHNSKTYTDVSWYKSDRGFIKGETKEIRILSDTPDIIYTQKTYIRDLCLIACVLVTASYSFIYEIVQYAKSKKNKN